MFAYGFAKSERDNISSEELAAFRMLATEILAYGACAIALALRAGVLIEVSDEHDETAA